MTPQSPTAVATERLKEILAGCETAPDNAWLIRKGGYFYRPDNCGYTSSKAQAGRYSEEEAKATHASSPRTITALPASEWPDEPYASEPSELRAIVSELLALRSPQDSQELVERLKTDNARLFEADNKHWAARERLTWERNTLSDDLDSARLALSTPSPRIVKLEARNAELEGGLGKPSSGEWHSMMEPHIARYDAAAVSGGRAIYNATGSAAMAKLLSIIARKLDGAAAVVKRAEDRAEAAEAALSTAEARGLERALAIGRKWARPSHFLLHAGEMSTQEKRTVVAVFDGMLSEIERELTEHSHG